MKGGEYTVYNWNDVDSPSVEVRRTVQTLTMEVSQIMKVGAGLAGGGLEGGRVRTAGTHRRSLACTLRCAFNAQWRVGGSALCMQHPPSAPAALMPAPSGRPAPAGWLQPLHGEGDF